MAQHVTVIGSGVSGLTTAIVLQERGWDVTILAAVPPQQTTSIVAAAIWYPYKAYPEHAVLGWGSTTFAVFAQLAEDEHTGVIMRDGVELWLQPMPDPWWRSAVPDFGRCTPADLPPGYQDGYAFRVPVIDMPLYLDYLVRRFSDSGGVFQTRQLRSLDEATELNALVVNCAGLGARDLLDDQTVKPIRGQVIWLTNPGIERFTMDEANPDRATYIIPRIHDVVLGGSADEDDWNTTPDSEMAEDILRRCVLLEPRLRDAHVIGHRVGLRPGRPAIRLEREHLPNGAMCIHNYGHGGAGVTLSWGCAEEVADLAAATS